MSERVDIKRLKEIVGEIVSAAVGEIEEGAPRITLAALERDPSTGRETWRVNVAYTPKPKRAGEPAYTRFAMLEVDASTGELLRLREGLHWAI
ncbi:MAG: hypothetical protein QXU97_04240 [Fervidicoccaceae archaeon]